MLLKPIADEIVVGVDSRVDVSSLSSLKSISDTLLRFEFRPPVDRPRAWLASQCKSDWIFWIDGDEIPSEALVAAIPQLTQANNILQFLFTRRWLFPDLNHWIDESPWWPDHQIRLMRNDPATMHFGLTHEPFMPISPCKVIDAPLYHLAALESEQFRRQKIDGYELERPGMVSPNGGPFNEVLLTPERYALRPPVAVPPGDRATIANVLSGESPGGRSKPRISISSAKRVDIRSPARRLREADYRASITVLETNVRLALGVGRQVLARVANCGKAIWPGGELSPQVRASYHWRRMNGEMMVLEGARTSFPSEVAPGESVLIPIHIDPPSAEGRYILELDLVHEHVRWFNCTARVEVDVALAGGRTAERDAKRRISVAICTRDRPHRLRAAIDSILRQEFPKDAVELLIIDNAEDQRRLAPLAKEYQAESNIRWCHEPLPGLSRARNMAARSASSDIIAFMDDDAVAAPSWLQNVVAAFDRFGSRTHALGGRVEPIWERERPAWLHDDLLGYYSVVDWGGAARHVGAENWIAGTNMAFRTDVLRAIGFSPALGRRGDHILLSNEEQEVLDVIRSRGGQVAYVPEARVGHAISAERLTQAWLRKRVVWQALSDFVKDGAQFERTNGEQWEHLRRFQSVANGEPIAAFGCDVEEPDAMKRQLLALHHLTLLMAGGLNAPKMAERQEHALADVTGDRHESRASPRSVAVAMTDSLQPYDAAFFDDQVAGSYRSASVILQQIWPILEPHSAVDVGCGLAPWLRAAQELGAARLLGIDGDYVDRKRLLVDPGCFKPVDLELGGFAIGDRYDLAISMEVAEHLSPGRAESFVRDLCALSDAVLFSAATPSQGGTNHLNEQWPQYWNSIFVANGYRCFDHLRFLVWDRTDVEWWYAQNVLVFCRPGSQPDLRLSNNGWPHASSVRAMVHPRNFLRAIDLARPAG